MNLLRLNFSYICKWENEIKLDFPGGGGGRLILSVNHYAKHVSAKTDQRTDREQYTRSNVVTARPLILVILEETSHATDWTQTTETDDKKSQCQQSHCWTPFTDETSKRWDSATCIHVRYSTDHYQWQGAPTDGFLPNTLKTLFRLSRLRVVLDF